ncbi:bifunctional 4-hydroxy-2-oxoglutarate aldolase/2-dehydro-3-deoxy-phosphogluconate aldolase [Leptolyngbya sp. FACHB-711]|jgi:2-dehydro-3-deoxyphosphogluconate aldolase/(4S)-4-hydroxy-2-oxoglutarate aldolase|uniref:bifunctional 4-hydroxy-2-oxoglutarate aldolase/2-dehydro-3-deoxy-phosphogluconate aldolase n=1 Tax=unclassified Leptolyngbya TaxID=2650499 RepID=UPI001684860C|nr:bifunctional 4-hydroxy-2-oxoglutarate aldolase/2-dehydro-3-deoxy-phosphogluconate aldolase [Leptolyngbya sp. FACHB-711]MBD2023201.1 bifunctional 4-hydroxy-2-oxoglutarate aldolase/2-dehydro-3-deoxy-phosphogluconate aldolase [Leptolyngbya sp. FACHB-711]
MSAAWLALLKQHRSIAVIRALELAVGIEMANATAAGGMRLIEITWNSDRPHHLIQQIQNDLPDCVIGAGTLRSTDEVQQAIEAGAQFLFSPHTDFSMIEAAVRREIPIVAGALTPTEIMQAWQAGAACVKVFPIQAVGGASYIRSLQEPLGGIPLIPTGGVTIDNAAEFIRAGAIAVGLAGQLFPKQAIEAGDWSIVEARSKQLVENLRSV